MPRARSRAICVAGRRGDHHDDREPAVGAGLDQQRRIHDDHAVRSRLRRDRPRRSAGGPPGGSPPRGPRAARRRRRRSPRSPRGRARRRAPTTPGPNSSTTRRNPGVPAATASRANVSADRITAPRSASMRATVDFPEPMPPVRPTSSMGGRAGGATPAPRDASGRRGSTRARRPPRLAAGSGSAACRARGRSLGRLGLAARRPAPPRPRAGGRRGSPAASTACSTSAKSGAGAIGSAGASASAAISGSGSASASISVPLGCNGWPTDLPHAEADAAAAHVDVDHLHADLVADREHGLGRLHVLIGELGDVDESLDPLRDPHERAERDELRDLALDDLAGLVLALELLPGILLRRLERQRDPLALEVDVEHLDLDLLADRARPRWDGRRASTRAPRRARGRRRRRGRRTRRSSRCC